MKRKRLSLPRLFRLCTRRVMNRSPKTNSKTKFSRTFIFHAPFKNWRLMILTNFAATTKKPCSRSSLASIKPKQPMMMVRKMLIKAMPKLRMVLLKIKHSLRKQKLRLKTISLYNKKSQRLNNKQKSRSQMGRKKINRNKSKKWKRLYLRQLSKARKKMPTLMVSRIQVKENSRLRLGSTLMKVRHLKSN